jgi:hypothetical protein
MVVAKAKCESEEARRNFFQLQGKKTGLPASDP